MTTTLICLMLHWWLKEIPKECTNIHLPKVDFVIHPDASQTDWGGATDREITQQGEVVRKP